MADMQLQLCSGLGRTRTRANEESGQHGKYCKEKRRRLTAHHLLLEVSYTASPSSCQKEAEGGPAVWMYCQAPIRTREYRMVNGQGKWLGLGGYQIAST